MFLLCYRTADPDWIDLLHRYWAMDENGKYRESAKTLLAATGTTHSAQQTALLATYATAHDTDRRYQCCGKPAEMRSRTSRPSFLRICETCRADQERAARVAANHEREQLNQVLRGFAERHASRTYDYLGAPDEVVLLVLALNRALGGRYFEIAFNAERCSSLSSIQHDNLLMRLYEAGALVHNPGKAPADAYELKDDSLRYYPGRVVFEATQSVHDGIDIVACLENREFTNGAALVLLWLEYATGECMAYLLDQAGRHGLQMSVEEDALITNTLRNALHRHSIAKLWNALWKVVRDAAAKSTTKYFNARRAASTLPNALRTHLAEVESGPRRLQEWRRPPAQPRPALGEIFWDQWSIDETTPGHDVSQLFGRLSDPSQARPATYTREAISHLLRQTLALDQAPEALSTFAEAILAGGSMDDALDAMAIGHGRSPDDEVAQD